MHMQWLDHLMIPDCSTTAADCCWLLPQDMESLWQLMGCKPFLYAQFLPPAVSKLLFKLCKESQSHLMIRLHCFVKLFIYHACLTLSVPFRISYVLCISLFVSAWGLRIIMWHLAGTLQTIRYKSHILKNVSLSLASVQLCNDYLVTQLPSIIIRDSYSDLQMFLRWQAIIISTCIFLKSF